MWEMYIVQVVLEHLEGQMCVMQVYGHLVAWEKGCVDNKDVLGRGSL